MRSFIIFGIVLVTLVTRARATEKCSSFEVRKEWRALSKTERKGWIDAVNCLNTAPGTGKLEPPVDTASYADILHHIPPPNDNSTYFDELVYAHMNLSPLIHWTGLFLPWHRAYLLEWTNILRSECGYNGVTPYWAWENDAADLEGSDIWDSDPESGLGEYTGDANKDYTIRTGALDISVAYPIPHKLRRHYTPYPYKFLNSSVRADSLYTKGEVRKLLATPEGNFTAFHGYLEKVVGMHAVIHLMMGGDMGTRCPKGTLGTQACPADRPTTFSANDPMFFLHHGNVDRLWWLWQEQSEANKYAFRGGSVQNRSSLDIYPNGQPPWLKRNAPLPSAGLYKEYTIEETFDTREWPWCYVYE